MIHKYLSVLAILFILPAANTCSAQVADSSKVVTSLNKCWRVFSHEYATIYALEEEEIKSYSKQKLCFNKDSVKLYSGVNYEPKYSVKKVNAEEYSKSNFDCNKRNLGILTDSLYEVTILSVKQSKDGKMRKMTDVVAFDGTCIYVVVDGVIFKMLDADNKVQARSSN